MNKEQVLDDIFKDDPLGILTIKPKSGSPRSADERLVASFEEINDFVGKYQREPLPDQNDISEHMLFARLKNLREDDDKIHQLKPYDIYNLLPSLAMDQVNEPRAKYSKPKEINSLDDLLADDALGVLGADDDLGLFDFKHTPKVDERESADFVARRKPCKNFDKYKERLSGVQQELKAGKRTLGAFKQNSLEEGAYYVHNGLLFLLEKIRITKKEHYKADGTRVREDGRTRCIFENGTESNMLKRSVEKILYDNGQVVSQNVDEVSDEFAKNFNAISSKDKASGFIYVLKSKSSDAQIASVKNLYKIGFSTTEVEERIKNAEQEPTYLMAPVSIICSWQCYNMDTHKLEQLLHNFFGNSCMEIDIFDGKGVRHTPREWFIAPLEIIEKAVELIISGEVVKYVFDGERERIVERG